MNALHSSGARAAICALLTLATGGAGAEPSAGGFRRIPQPPGHGGFHGGLSFFFPVEREIVTIEREVVREVPAEPASAPAPPPPRKPYVVGDSYDSLPPEGCMKLIEDGESFYYCSGEWYRQIAARSYKAVARP